MQMNRRKLLKGATALVAASFISKPTFASGDTIKLGSLLDTSGIFDAYGKPMDKTARLAVEQINASGGLLGKQIEYILYDTQSNMALYTQFGKKLARTDNVDVMHGGILSASREAVRQTFRKRNIPYFYNVLYEGGVCDRNIFINGITPAQQVKTLVPAAVKKFGKKIYVLAADYNYGQITANWIKKYAEEVGAEIVQTDFFPLDVADFGSTIAKIQTAKPDMILSVLVGGAHISFYRQWAASGMNQKIPMASTTLGVGNEQNILAKEETEGVLVAYNYSQELPNALNQKLLADYKAKYGSIDDLHSTAVSHYEGILTWAKAVRQADSVKGADITVVLEAGLSIDTPSGQMTVDAKTHHSILDVHLCEFRNKKMEILESFPQQQPLDTQAVCDLIKNPNDNQQYEIKI
ncbi:MAG: transporter substrate-binding protein [Rhizobiales bacterium]|nr:transporter substrate-binding protein [Hyphomicrobiales bacterium]